MASVNLADKRLEYLRKSTEKLIEGEPTHIRLFRPPRLTSDGQGGLTRAGADVDLGMKHRYFSAVMDPVKFAFGNVEFEEGKRHFWSHIIIGPHEDDILEGDYFTHQGSKYIVGRVHPDRSYQTKAIVGAGRHLYIG